MKVKKESDLDKNRKERVKVGKEREKGNKVESSSSNSNLGGKEREKTWASREKAVVETLEDTDTILLMVLAMWTHGATSNRISFSFILCLQCFVFFQGLQVHRGIICINLY